MFKARNIMIIFALNYLLILLVCCLLEIIFISNHAQEAQLLMRTAAPTTGCDFSSTTVPLTSTPPTWE